MRKAHRLVLACAAAAACERPPRDVCTIGVLVPQAVAFENLAREIRRARDLVADSVRALQSPIVLWEINTQGDPALAATRVPQAVSERKIPVVVGSLLSSETHQFAERVVTGLGAVILANGSSDPTFTQLPWRRDNDGFFRNWPPDDAEAKTMAEYVLSRGVRRLAVMHARDKYSEALTQAFVATFQTSGGTVVGDVRSYVPSSPTLSRMLAPLASEEIDGVYIVGLPRDLGQLYLGLRDGAGGERHRTKPFFTGVAVEGADFRSAVGGIAVRDLVYSAPEVDRTAESYRRFTSLYRRRFQTEPDVFSAVAYDALWLAVLSIDQGRQCSSARARQFLHSMAAAYPGASGPTRFTARGDVMTKTVAIRALNSSGSDLLELRKPTQR